MKVLLPFVAVLAFAVAPIDADDSQVPRDSLARMGLVHLKPLSDAEGTQIRGEYASTSSRARVGNTTRTQSRTGSSFAYSSRFISAGGTVAGGGAFATAH